MSIITFKSNSNKETGNTSSAIAVATYMSIQHNMKILLISTSFNDDTIRESFWNENNKKTMMSHGPNKSFSNIQSGIEGLSRMISSSKIEPRIIRDYTKVVLTGRFDVLLGYKGEESQYKEIQDNYPQVISVANQYYDMVIVDLDRNLTTKVQEQIIQTSDIIVTTTCQKVKDMQSLSEYINKNNVMTEVNTLVTIGRYDDSLKCNIKNATRSIFKKRKNINSVPYNGKFYEAMEEGTVIDLFLNLLRMKNKKDHNYFFLQEIQRLAEDINHKWEEVKIRKHI